MSDRSASFDITKCREEESDCKNVKLTQGLHGKPLEIDEKLQFEQEMAFVLYEKKR